MDRTRFTAAAAAFLFAMLECAVVLADFGPDGPDPRGISLAGAMTTEADGPSAVFWNPARLASGRGSSALLSLGSMPRPDHRAGDFGGSDRIFAGASFGAGKEGEAGRIGIAAALERPWPRFSYAITRPATIEEASAPSTLDATVSQIYTELLIGAGMRILSVRSGKSRLCIDAGISAGLGFSVNRARADLAPDAAPLSAVSDSKSGSSLSLPAAAGICMALDSPTVDFRFAIKYRGVMPLSDSTWLDLGGTMLTEKDLFMPPPQQGSVAAGVTFFDLLTATIELGWNFYDVPDAFQRRFPNHHPVWKFGFEYKVPFGKDGSEISLRTGMSRSLVPECPTDSIYSSDAAALNLGWGFTPDGNLEFDLFLSALLLTGRRAGINSAFAGMSCGFAF